MESGARTLRSEEGWELIYPILLVAGFAGLVVMALLGFMHGGDHGHGHGHDAAHGHHLDVHHGHAHAGHHGGHGHSHAGHGQAAHGHHSHGVGHHGQGQDGQDGQQADGDGDGQQSGAVAVLMWLMPLLSPLNWFSWMLGAGAAGSLASGVMEPARAAIAVGGALGFNLLVVKPIWKFIFGFTSRPARNLEGCLLQQVEAVTGFDERGEGLVRVTIDGHSEDVLARLVDPDRALNARVRRGDQLLIEEVDPRTNSCRVSRV